MGFASPIWLLGLLPWAALMMLLLPGKDQPAMVPFLRLWLGTSLPARSAARRWPRKGVLLAIASLLLAILAAGQPFRSIGVRGDSEKKIDQHHPESVEPQLAITSIGARPLPHPQVMVRIENHSQLSTVAITVQSDDAVIHQRVELPSQSLTADRFIDMPKLGKTVEASIGISGAVNAWSRAFLVRQSDGINIAVDPSVDASVQRMAKIYSANRPVGASAKTAIISNRQIPADQNGIWMGGSPEAAISPADFIVVPHAVTQNVKRWIAGDAAKSPTKFVPLVFSGTVPVVAVRDDSVRQIWLNADVPRWSKTADFVVFFANALDWISGQDSSYTSIALADLGDQWRAAAGTHVPADVHIGQWPGIYESATGRQIAVNAGTYPELADAKLHSTNAGSSDRVAGHQSMAGSIVIAALTLLLLAVIVW